MSEISVSLKRKVRTEGYLIVMEIGVKESREEYFTVLKLAQERGDRVSLQEIATELLQRSTAVRAAFNLARRLEELSLLEKVEDFKRSQEYLLTSLGKRSLEEKGVYIPESETYEVLLAHDPLIPEKILYIKPSNQSIHDYIEMTKNEGYFDNDDLINTPEWLKKLEKKRFEVVYEEGDGKKNKKDIEVISIMGKMKFLSLLSKKFPLQLEISLSNYNPATEFIIQDSLSMRKNLPFGTLLFEEIWQEMLQGLEIPLHDVWNSQTNSIKVSFSNIETEERNNFKRKIYFPPITFNVIELGIFEKLDVSDVQIEPLTTEDANIWAVWYFLENFLREYIDELIYKEYFNQVMDIEPFKRYEIIFPTRQMLINYLNKKQGEYENQISYLQAPIDLNPGEGKLE